MILNFEKAFADAREDVAAYWAVDSSVVAGIRDKVPTKVKENLQIQAQAAVTQARREALKEVRQRSVPGEWTLTNLNAWLDDQLRGDT